jgi:hypothetical protein
VTSAIALEVDLPPSATPQLVFHTARAAGLQIRELGVRRESVEAAFLRVLGEAPSPPLGVPQSPLTRALAGGAPGPLSDALERRSVR